MKKQPIKKIIHCSLLIVSTSLLIGDDGYRMPPKAIADLVDAPVTPLVNVSPDKSKILIMERSSLPSIKELSQPELRLAGLRINPMTNGRSRTSYYIGLAIQDIQSGKQRKVKGLPNNGRISNVTWAPDGNHIAMAVTKGNEITLYIANVSSGKAKQLLKTPLNAIYGSAYHWLSDSKGLLAKTILNGRGNTPEKLTIPSGPVIQENAGQKSPARTYQDLLTNAHDEALFEYYMLSLIHI